MKQREEGGSGPYKTETCHLEKVGFPCHGREFGTTMAESNKNGRQKAIRHLPALSMHILIPPDCLMPFKTASIDSSTTVSLFLNQFAVSQTLLPSSAIFELS